MRKLPLLIPCLVMLLAASAVADTSAQSSTKPATTPASRPEKPVVLPTKPGSYKFHYKTTLLNGHKVEMAYRIFVPLGYDKNLERYPLLVFYHGAGEAGDDGAGLLLHGPLHELDNPAMAESFPMIVLAPQCPPRGERWDQPDMIDAAVALVREVAAKMRVDRDRIYGTGLSMGGKGTWLTALAAPDLWAAIAPISASPEQPEEASKKLLNIAVWMGIGEGDDDSVDGAKKMGDALQKSHADVRVSLIPGAGHGCWPMFYSNASFYEWMLQHRRGQAGTLSDKPTAWPPENPPPVTSAGCALLSFPTKAAAHDLMLEYTLYRAKPGQAQRPLTVFLHEGERLGTILPGRHYADLAPFAGDLVLSGPALEVMRPASKIAGTCAADILSPRLPPGRTWDEADMQNALNDLIQHVIQSQHNDPARVYICGVNDGARAAYQMIQKHPGCFAAGAVFFNKDKFAADGPDSLKLTPLCVIESPGEPSTYQSMRDQITASKTDSRVSALPTPDYAAISTLFADPAFYDWLLHHKLSAAPK